MMPCLYRWWGSLFRWVGAFCIKRGRLHCCSLWHRGYLPISLPPFYLALPSMTQFRDWLHCFWGSLSASINGHRHHSLCLTYMFLPRSVAKSHYLWSSPILSGCSGRCPWQKLQLPIFPPQGSFTGRSLGDHLTTFLLWHPPFFTSYRGSLAWGGAGTPVPYMTASHTQGNANLWCDEKKLVLVEDLWPSALVHHFVRGGVSCNLMQPFDARLQVHCTYFSVIVPFLLACFWSWMGLCLLQGSPQSISYRSYIHVHMLSRGLSHGGLIAANCGEDKVNWEPRPSSKHQIVWTIPSNWGSGGIIGVKYFSQMRWPVGFFVFSQLPNHAHNYLVWSLYQPICLGVVGHGLQLFDTKDLAQFLNYTTGEASTPIT